MVAVAERLTAELIVVWKAAVREAVAAERERCAQRAEAVMTPAGAVTKQDFGLFNETRKAIAAAIRGD